MHNAAYDAGYAASSAWPVYAAVYAADAIPPTYASSEWYAPVVFVFLARLTALLALFSYVPWYTPWSDATT